jgi:RNA polymerase sigma factor (TIGR02999 family)
MPEGHDVTLLLADLARGDRGAVGKLMPLLYDDLRAMAGSLFRDERVAHTLQPTALVHEAFLRLAGGGGQAGANRAQFLAVAAKVMRQLLVDHARAQRAQKRGGGQVRSLMAMDTTPSPDAMREVDIVDLDDALRALSEQYPRAAEVVELRYFGGLSGEEVASWLGISDATAERDWTLARGWLARRFQPGAMS